MSYTMKRIILAALVSGLVGCSGPPYVMQGNDRTVTVNWRKSSDGRKGTLAIADAHCAKYGRKARYLSEYGAMMTYDCVE